MALRTIALGCALLGVPGCTLFGVRPIPERLPPAVQAKQDAGWSAFVAICPDVERTALLDAVLLRQAWHAGVDRMEVSSEKQVGAVLVRMTSHFERSSPEQDYFAIAFLGPGGVVIRSERYSPDELDAAVALYLTHDHDDPNEPPEQRAAQAARMAEREARMTRAKAVFPYPPEETEPE